MFIRNHDQSLAYFFIWKCMCIYWAFFAIVGMYVFFFCVVYVSLCFSVILMWMSISWQCEHVFCKQSKEEYADDILFNPHIRFPTSNALDFLPFGDSPRTPWAACIWSCTRQYRWWPRVRPLLCRGAQNPRLLRCPRHRRVMARGPVGRLDSLTLMTDGKDKKIIKGGWGEESSWATFCQPDALFNTRNRGPSPRDTPPPQDGGGGGGRCPPASLRHPCGRLKNRQWKRALRYADQSDSLLHTKSSLCSQRHRPVNELEEGGYLMIPRPWMHYSLWKL